MRANGSPLWQNRIIGILAIAICAAALWLNHRINHQVDITANASNSLSQATVDTLVSLKGPLTLTAVVGPQRSVRDAITRLVEQCRVVKDDIALNFINPEVEPEKARAHSASLDGELIIQFKEREKRLQNLSERSFTQALHELSREQLRKLGFISGHDERNPERQTNEDFYYLAQQLKQSGLEPIRLSLVTEPSIPDNIDALVIAAPRQRYFPGEVASVLDYIGRGGNILWLIEDGNLAGLDAIALELGIAVHSGTVIDMSSQAYGADSPAFTIIDQFPTHPVNTGLDNAVLLPVAAALDLTPLAGQTTLPLLQTSTQSWTETGALEGAIKFDDKTDEQQGPLTLAASIERENNNRTQRIVVIADADLFASTWIGNGANKTYADRVFNWLAGDDELIEFDTVAAHDQLQQLSTRQILYLGGGFLVAMPLLLLLIALLRWYQGRHA